MLSSYLSNRRQCIFVNNTFSYYSDVTTGVPQGSVLGPLLFLLYVNDIQNAVPNVPIRLFADDTNVFLADKNCADLIKNANLTLRKLKDWFDANKLTLHIGKTSFTIFHAHNKSHSCYDSFSFDGSEIFKSPFTKYLGLIIDENLSWRHHINDLCKRLLKYIGIFYQIRNTLPTETAIQIYYSFIYSQLSYAIEIYGTASTTFLNPLQILQNRLIKLLTMKPRRFSTNQLYLEYNLLKIKDIHSYNIGGIVFKYCNGMLPSVLADAIHLSKNNESSISTRNNDLFHVTHHKTVHGKFQLNNYFYNIWHKLPSTIKSNNSLQAFQKSLKTMLIHSYRQ